MAEIILPPGSEQYPDMLKSSQIVTSTVSSLGPAEGIHRANTAAVVRDDSNYIYTASTLTGDASGIIETVAGGDLWEASQAILTMDGEVINTVPNTPLAATVVWDNSQINLYYMVPNTNGGAFLQEACQRGDGGWIQGALGEALLRENVFPALDSSLTVWTNKEEINVFFKSITDQRNEITFAKYFPDNESWNVKKIKVQHYPKK